VRDRCGQGLSREVKCAAKPGGRKAVADPIGTEYAELSGQDTLGVVEIDDDSRGKGRKTDLIEARPLADDENIVGLGLGSDAFNLA